MRSIVMTGLVCLLAALAAPAQVIVEGGGGPPTVIPNGASIWYAAGSPTNTIGSNGDYYVNTSSYCLYGPKANGIWPATCISSVRQLGYVAENLGNKGTAGGYAPLDSSGLVPAANLPPVTAVNGTSIASNAAPDQTVVTTAPAVGAWTALPACPDTGGNHLNYSVTTHGFLCGNTGGTAGSVSFGAVGGGTNSNSLLIGGSLSYSNGGQINANQLSGVTLAGLATGLLKINTGTGIPSVAAASDVAATLGFTPENTANRGAVNGYAPLDANQLLPAANLPAITALNGTSIPGNGASDQTVVTTAPAVGSWAALPACPDTGGNHLNYSVVTHGFLCGNTGGTAGSVGFQGVGNGTNANALLVSGTLGYTGLGLINANQLSGVSLAGLPTGLLKITNGTGTPSVAISSDVTATLGYAPENPANKGTANGYAPLGSSATVPLLNLPTIPYGQTSGVQAALGFTPENSANKGGVNGYAPLDSGAHLPAANMPALAGDLTSSAGSASATVNTVLSGQTPITTTSIGNGTLSPSFTNLQATGTAQFGSGTYQSTVSSSFTANRNWVVPDFSGTMVLNGSLYAVGGGSAQTQTVTLPGPVTSYAAGMQVEWLPVAANTGSGPTMNVNSLGPVTITKCGGAALAAGDLVTTAVAFGLFDGTNLELQNPQAVGCTSPAVAQLPNSTLMALLGANANGGSVAVGASYLGMGASASSTTEAARVIFAPAGCTLRNFHITTTSTNNSGGSIVLTVRINQTTPSGGPTITINSGDTAQNYADTTHSATLASNSNWDVLVQNNGSSSYNGLAGWSIGCLPN